MKLRLLVLFVLASVFCFGQSNYVRVNQRYKWIAGGFDSTFHIPSGATPSLRTGGWSNPGGLFYSTADSSVYAWSGYQWIKLGGDNFANANLTLTNNRTHNANDKNIDFTNLNTFELGFGSNNSYNEWGKGFNYSYNENDNGLSFQYLDQVANTDESFTQIGAGNKIDLFVGYKRNARMGYFDLQMGSGNEQGMVVDSSGFLFKPLLGKVRIDSLATATSMANKTVMVWDSATQRMERVIKDSVGGGGTPSGNYGNLQINRNGSFSTPSGDSLTYTSNSGLVVNNSLTTTGFLSAQNANITSTLTTPIASVTNYVQLTQTSAPSNPGSTAGVIWAEEKNGKTLFKVKGSGGVERTLARDNTFVVRNTSGSTINKGQLVYVTGTTGQTPNIALADASDPAKSAYGMAAEDISNNGFGFVTSLGNVSGLVTEFYPEGSVLYLSTTPGLVTTTAPSHPNMRQAVGIVLKQHLTQGIIGVDIGVALGDFYGTRQNEFKIGNGSSGAKKLTFSNGASASIQWNPSESHTATLQDTSGTIAYLHDFTQEIKDSLITTDDTETSLFEYEMESGAAGIIEVDIVSINEGGEYYTAKKIIHWNNLSAAVDGVTTVSSFTGGGWAGTIDADLGTSNDIRLRVTGESGTEYKWYAKWKVTKTVNPF